MSRYLPLVLAASVGWVFSACETTKPDEEQGGRFGHGSTTGNHKPDDSSPEPTPRPKTEDNPRDGDSVPPVDVEPKATPLPTPVVQDYPTAVPVPGKPGFVKSIEGSGIVDVRGYPPGTEVKDPYSGKVFLVP